VIGPLARLLAPFFLIAFGAPYGFDCGPLACN
jgi:hypothetical protein